MYVAVDPSNRRAKRQSLCIIWILLNSIKVTKRAIVPRLHNYYFYARSIVTAIVLLFHIDGSF